MDQITMYQEILKFDNAHSESTIQAYIGDLKRFRDYLERKYRAALSRDLIIPLHFTEFLESENYLGFSANTLQRRKIVLGQFAQYLLSVGLFTSEQVNEVLAWRINLWQDIYQQEVEYLSEEIVGLLLGEDSGDGIIRIWRDKAILSLLLETGLAISSVIELRLDQVNLKRNILELKESNGFVYHIPISTACLNKYIKEERPDLIQAQTEPILFVSQLGGPISRQGVWQMLKKIGERMEPAVKLAPRVLRNTAVKAMIEEGLSVVEIQHRLGHQNIYSTRALVRKIKRTEKNRR